ncbi:helix-turn-helix domain-containing protein [Tenacibaculum piscium]|uniref:helix-turn-helix domain-containing protein n=1 Tax=Tenacibaculum piscium TaxID=1458515 RepID=UPI001F2D9922|nr:helix-turn-helix transcriptional regulator [Tenacibaculum piscium]
MANEHLIKHFGLRIRELREHKNISQEKLSFFTGFHRTYIGMIERGERNISLTNMAVFAKVFELNISELLDFKTINFYKEYETKIQK